VRLCSETFRIHEPGKSSIEKSVGIDNITQVKHKNV
jgi:hypothetical protein